ncbi:MAG: hypothetical protein JWM98_2100 [Thermoleophilia bacterium]|nr:hypothetical protein [Thermoleophilia bacterium]
MHRGYIHGVRLFALLLAACLVALCCAASVSSGASDRRVPSSGHGRVLVAPLTGTVDPVMLEFTERVLERARHDHFDAVVFRIDTPGGLSTSMDDIVRAIVAADLPVYVYVSPSAGRAASAGVFITYAADVAAMSPGTNIGSATPISSGGEQLPKDLRRKVINDAVAKITELADERGRDAKFAEAAIREAENVGAREALRRHVVDYVADDVRDLLRQSSGDSLDPKGLTPHLADATLTQMDVPLTLVVLKHLIDPNILFLLFGAGVIGLAFELTHPGVVLPGVAGGICFLLALFGLSILPATGAGVALLVLAAALFAAEAVAPGGGVLGGGGAIALVVGAMLLFDDSSGYGVSPALAVGMSAALALFFGFILRKAIQTRRLAPMTGSGSLVGMPAQVRRAVGGGAPGTVYVDGELWRARLAAGQDGVLEAGAAVRVLSVDGMQVEVGAVPVSTNEGATT